MIFRLVAGAAKLLFWLALIPVAPWFHDWPSRVEPAGDREELRERPVDVLIQWLSIAWWLTIAPAIAALLLIPILTQVGALAAAYLLMRRLAAARGIAPGFIGWGRLALRTRIGTGIFAVMLVALTVAHVILLQREVGGGSHTGMETTMWLTWGWALAAGTVGGIAAIRILGPEQARMLQLRGQVASILGVTPEELRPSVQGASIGWVIPPRAAMRTTEQITTAARSALPRWQVQRVVGDDGTHSLWLHPLTPETAQQRAAEEQSGGLLGDAGQAEDGEGVDWTGWQAA